MLRDYQQRQKNEIIHSWNRGTRNILSVMPCGAGKTVNMSDMFDYLAVPGIAIAHRQELVSQISLTLARWKIHHRIIAPTSIIRFIINQHVAEHGQSYVDSKAPIAVAGVDTLIRRTDEIGRFAGQVRIWQTDEAHHLLFVNKWGKAVEAFPNAFGLGWTATPCRADRKALRRGHGGVFDEMIIGPTMRELIDQGHLCDYVIYGPPSDLDLSHVETGDSGEFKSDQLREATHRSTITGDIVRDYLKYAPGKLGVTFAVDVAMGEEHTAAFIAAGVPSALITAKTPDHIRAELIRAFKRGDLKQLVNVDIFGEGFDLPALEVVSMGRATQSYPLYVQQFCRALRTLTGKTHGIIIDHVGNVMRHGLPDAARSWTLDAPERRKRAASDELPVRICVNPDCFRAYEGYSIRCPYCGHKPAPMPREAPELVEGDLTEYTPELLARMRGEAERIAAVPDIEVNSGRDYMVREAVIRRADAQADLRDALTWWAGVRRDVYGDEDSTSYRRFYRKFGIDVGTAQTLGAPEALKLYRQVWDDIQHDYTAKNPGFHFGGSATV